MPYRRRVGRPRVRRRVGGSILGSIGSFFRKAHDFVKSNGLVSKGLNAVGLNKYGAIASQLGYRPRRRVRRVARRRY